MAIKFHSPWLKWAGKRPTATRKKRRRKRRKKKVVREVSIKFVDRVRERKYSLLRKPSIYEKGR